LEFEPDANSEASFGKSQGPYGTPKGVTWVALICIRTHPRNTLGKVSKVCSKNLSTAWKHTKSLQTLTAKREG
jgi:hypothetical protein